MRHANTGRKFDRDTSSRRAMFRNLVANLFAHGRIETTVPKAKELRGIAEKIITKAVRLGEGANAADASPAVVAKRLAVKRDIAKFLPRWGERLVGGETERLDMVEHLFREIAPRFVGRPGGYTRINRTRFRRGDNAEMALISFVDYVPGAAAAPAAPAAPAASEAGEGAAQVTEAVRTKAPKAAKNG